MHSGSGSGTSDSTASSAVWSSTSEALPAFAASELLPTFAAQNTQIGDHTRAPGTSVADSALDIDSLHEIKQGMSGSGDWTGMFPWCGQDEEGARDGAPSPSRRTTTATLPVGW